MKVVSAVIRIYHRRADKCTAKIRHFALQQQNVANDCADQALHLFLPIAQWAILAAAFSAVVDSVFKHDALSHKTALRSVKVPGVQVRRVAKSPKVLFTFPLEPRVQGRLARILHSGECSPGESGIKPLVPLLLFNALGKRKWLIRF